MPLSNNAHSSSTLSSASSISGSSTSSIAETLLAYTSKPYFRKSGRHHVVSAPAAVSTEKVYRENLAAVTKAKLSGISTSPAFPRNKDENPITPPSSATTAPTGYKKKHASFPQYTPEMKAKTEGTNQKAKAPRRYAQSWDFSYRNVFVPPGIASPGFSASGSELGKGKSSRAGAQGCVCM